MIENKGERLTTLGFGIPNLLKFGEVGYFPEQFLVELGLQGKTASEIQSFFISTGMDIDVEGFIYRCLVHKINKIGKNYIYNLRWINERRKSNN